MAAYSSIPSWRTPWVEEPGGLQSMGLKRTGHDCSNGAHMRLSSRVRIWAQLGWVLLVQGPHKVTALLRRSGSGHSWAGCSGSRSPQGCSIAQGVKIWAQLGWALLVQGPHRLQHCSVLVISRLSWGGGDPSLSSCTSGSLTVGGNTRSLTQGSATQRSSSCFL